MKHIKAFNESGLSDLLSGTNVTPNKEWMGIYLTYAYQGVDGIGARAVAIVADGWETAAKYIFEEYGMLDWDDEEYGIEINTLSSVEEILDAVQEYYRHSNNASSDVDSIEYVFKEMTPIKMENASESAELLETMEVIKLGKKYFREFSSI